MRPEVFAVEIGCHLFRIDGNNYETSQKQNAEAIAEALNTAFTAGQDSTRAPK